MTIRNLDLLFNPTNVVLIGASERHGSIGKHVAENLLKGGFKGEIAFINPKRDEILGKPCFKSVDRLPFTPGLAVIATPPETVPGVVDELGRKGCRAAVVITAGVSGDLRKRMLEAARPHLLRIIGPNCLGMQVPRLGLDASFAQVLGKPGSVALVSQSGAITTAMLDWAAVEGVGFSHVVSIGDAADVDLGDMLDYLAGETTSRAVFLYIESVGDARKFMSAARRCARVKPVIAIKAGRHPEGAKAAASHTGALAGSDNVYGAALRRAGVLRVTDLDAMFDAAEMLAYVPAMPGDRVAVVTNGGGAGVLAVDSLTDFHGALAQLAPETVDALDAVLPPTWSHGNPVDIIGDAGPERYRATLDAVLADPTADAVLVINCPTALASSLDGAKAVVAAVQDMRAKGRNKPVIANWLARQDETGIRDAFAAAKIPSYETPVAAVRGMMHLVHYRRAQTELMQTPPALPENLVFDAGAVSAEIAQVLAEKRDLMTEPEAKAVLAAYGIPTVPTRVARTPEEAGEAAAELLRRSPSVVVKILSRNLSHKSDIGGVRLDLMSAEAVETATHQMLTAIGEARPDAILEGVTVQPMVRRPNAYELILGITTDPTFGPVILFGAGGTGVEAIGDTAMSLTPLDLKLARDLIASTRIYKLLKGFRDRPPVDLDGLALCLVKLSSLAVQHRAIRELDINPLLIDAKGMIALDARIKVVDPAEHKPVPCAIRPYPVRWEAHETLLDGSPVTVRPIRPDDEHFYPSFMSHVTPEDLRLRLFSPVRQFSHHFLARLTQIDYAREMAFIAVRPAEDGGPSEMLGVARFFADPDYEKGEYAVLIRSDLKGRGLGWVLMRQLIGYAREEGLKQLYGSVLEENTGMLQMCQALGFHIARDPDDARVFAVTLDLSSPAVDEVLKTWQHHVK
ncbi:bifunctional acetate--CoA ligase family protein/GNAT family N-acetyltransferase [Rhodomicrobium lacus]|uniref:bifunctional acetate--CoA ligase family protein/GNAT family N-acetyltransferase n=1 Tax=Rhodomicrobium lacus TaxID=2498452 RepID=UPI0026E34B57|nr:bifunctional acetate--CoA ligase family protein/GNAT family N-acetyltransferase [Rhodomicrobium lacus]WKW49670.1 bifunctional acetate--CoA ligase family protein/GNAT family N-acetyltransferase [Rhodomicrobium lacus]